MAQGSENMIVVLPDSKTIHNGSMYSSSATTGDFEQYIAHDVVAFIDAHYRTIAKRTSRGLVGHSMGGYGASRIGMKHSDVFGSLYIMSPCCMVARGAGSGKPGDREGARIGQNSGGLGETALRPAGSACLGCGVVAQSEESAALSRSPDEERRSESGRDCEVGGECAAGVRRSIYKQPASVSRDFDRRRRPGRT